MNGLIMTDSGIVLPEWIDRNTHMNVAYYVVIFDRGIDVLLRKSILSVAGIDKEIAMVASRNLIEYRKELLVGEHWELWSGIVSVDPSYITSIHKIRSGTSTRAVCQIRSSAFSLDTRMATTLKQAPVDIAKKYLLPGIVDKFKH